ncbi:TetR/AcrR family transcriptional regulator [Roseixanthobacter glucoisosaccharinicivorans]|uniref:TetR/AcrR family transcriptional regulator n=1 Tax=Roseixanthobacter glucoisosaccharinicivorans TaxID=3119923 RepID=UPI00372ACDF6
MSRTESPARSRILEAAYAQFYTHGFKRTGMEAIAVAAGLTKRTLYQTFESKDALLTAVVDYAAALSLPRIARWIAALEADPLEGIDTIFADLTQWTSAPGWMGSGFTRVVTEMADLPDHPANRVARAHKEAIEARLAHALGSADLASELMIVLEGTLILFLIRREKALIAAGARAARTLVKAARRSSKPLSLEHFAVSRKR